MLSSWANSSTYGVYVACIIANALGTVASQSAFNYQTIASSLEPDKNNRVEKLK